MLGMKEKEMKQIAQLIHDAVIKDQDVKDRVHELKSNHQEIAYSLDRDLDL